MFRISLTKSDHTKLWWNGKQWTGSFAHAKEWKTARGALNGLKQIPFELLPDDTYNAASVEW
jgi:hypothetical protein